MTPSNQSDVNVLVVDDDEDTSELLGLLFARQGWKTTFATNLGQARRTLTTGNTSMLVADMDLPDGRGLSLLDGGRPPSLRVAIILSGRVTEAERHESVNKGFDACVMKPFVGSQLVDLLATTLGARDSW